MDPVRQDSDETGVVQLSGASRRERRHENVDKRLVKRSAAALQKATPHLLGVVFNRVDVRARDLGHGRGGHHHRAPALARLFEEQGVKSILDLGCGDGGNLVFFARLGFAVSGLDYAPTALRLAREWFAQEGLAADGYRLVVNSGEKSGQAVFHIHVHILSGRAMNWPPG